MSTSTSWITTVLYITVSELFRNNSMRQRQRVESQQFYTSTLANRIEIVSHINVSKLNHDCDSYEHEQAGPQLFQTATSANWIRRVPNMNVSKMVHDTFTQELRVESKHCHTWTSADWRLTKSIEISDIRKTFRPTVRFRASNARFGVTLGRASGKTEDVLDE